MLFLYRPRQTWMPYRLPRNLTQQGAYNRDMQERYAATRRVPPAAPEPAAKARPSTATKATRATQTTKTAKASKAAAPASKPSTAAAKPASTPALSPGKLKAAVKRVERSK